MNRLLRLIGLLAWGVFASQALAAEKLVLVADGACAPIVVAAEAPPSMRTAADELAEMIGRISGQTPEVIVGAPWPLPGTAIWVGDQPGLATLFPELDLSLDRPEEIVIAATAQHLLILGRDIYDPDHLVVEGQRYTVEGMQQEYGTANAVYTFMQEHLDVRWLWPGELGIDVVESKTIALEPFVYRYAPPLRSRSGLFQFALPLRVSAYGHSEEWVRRQRIQLDSLRVSGGHAFRDWWDRFHETHPEYFALQPDGSRGGGDEPYPSARTVKLCQSNPAVWEQWLRDVEAQIAHNPGLTCFNASPNDGYGLGNCVCENCQAWDHPDAPLRPFLWKGLAKRAPALADRHVTFANHCARLLEARYPGKGYLVSMNAYGNSRPAPLRAVPADNVVISNVANNFWSLDTVDKDTIEGTTYADHYAAWGKLTEKQIWRPNPGNPAGWWAGLPDITPERTMASFQFAMDNHCIGIIVDSILEQWATQGPLYYVLAQMTWNPNQDWRAVMDDYYQRGFGPAAPLIKAYWQLIEVSRNRVVDAYPNPARGFVEVYDEAFFAQASGLLDQAAEQVADGPATYRERVEFVRIGLEFTRIADEIRRASIRWIAEDMVDDSPTAQLLREKWDALEATSNRIPHAVYWPPLRPNERMARSGLLHPDQIGDIRAKWLKPWRLLTLDETSRVALQQASAGDWQLAFIDDFERPELGPDWQVLDGEWRIEEGALRGHGVLISERLFPADGAPAYQRLEFDAAIDMTKDSASDLSSLLHLPAVDSATEALGAGYFFQFGGEHNKRHQISRAGEVLVVDTSRLIRIHKWQVQEIVVENDQGRLTLYVDGRAVVSVEEDESQIGAGRGRIGLMFGSPARVSDLKVYIKPLASGLDEEAEVSLPQMNEEKK